MEIRRVAVVGAGTMGEAYRPSPILEKPVAEGRPGRKVGKGVYEYDDNR